VNPRRIPAGVEAIRKATRERERSSERVGREYAASAACAATSNERRGPGTVRERIERARRTPGMVSRERDANGVANGVSHDP
jgi:hypothetical protein